MDDRLKNSPSLKPVESGTPPVEAATSARTAGVVLHTQSSVPASASTPPQDELGTKDTPLAPHVGAASIDAHFNSTAND